MAGGGACASLRCMVKETLSNRSAKVQTELVATTICYTTCDGVTIHILARMMVTLPGPVLSPGGGGTLSQGKIAQPASRKPKEICFPQISNVRPPTLLP